jgi:cephalosporin hydroxylase
MENMGKGEMMEAINVGRKPMRTKITSREKSVIAVHEAKSIPYIYKIVQEFDPELMIELGTSWGGITFMLHECNPGVELHSYDIDCQRKPDRSLFNNNVKFHLVDILESPLKQIVNLCQDKRRKILYCDNGHKITEVILYGSKLNKGDMLGVHDWGSEIHYDYDRLARTIRKNKKKYNIRELMKRMNSVLEDFEPIEHKFFEDNNFSSRFWIRERR